MAYTKAPVNDTHNTIRISAKGSPFLTSGGGYIPQSCKVVDGFPLTEKQWDGEPETRFHKRTGWKRRAVATGSVTTTGGLSRSNVLTDDSASPVVFFGKANQYYGFNLSTNVVSASITTHPGGSYAAEASGTTFIDSSNNRRVAFLGYDQLQTWSDPVGATPDTTSLAALSISGERGLVFINGYLFAVNTSGTRIYNSDPAGNYTTWNSTNFIDAEQYGDPIVWIEAHKNFLVAFGTKSIEFFYDGGVEVGSPLVRQESYSSKVGLQLPLTSPGGRRVARIGDDLYFVGSRGNDSMGLFRIRNFQVEEVGSQYLSGSLNFSSSGTAVANTYLGIDTIIQDNNPMVLMVLSGDQQLVYFPAEDTFIEFTVNTSNGYDIPDYNLRAGGWVWHAATGVAACVGQASLNDATMYMWHPDATQSVTTTMTMFSAIIDNGINFRKHIARVDAVGDFNNNDLTLAYNTTPNYASSYTSTYSINSNTIGYGNNVSWYNLGAFRRYSLKLTVAGTHGAIIDGLDVEYNIGAA